MAGNWNEIQGSNTTCWNLLGSNEPGDRSQSQFTNPDVDKTKPHRSIGNVQVPRYSFNVPGHYDVHPASAGTH